MIPINADEITKFRVEIDNAIAFKKENFGSDISDDALEGAAENINYYEFGMSSDLIRQLDDDQLQGFSPINVIYPIVKNIIPTLYYKNPHVNALPKRPEDEDSATYVSHILNYYYDELDIKEINKNVIFDAYVFGFGISKIGYTTRFGTVPTEDLISKEKKEREKEKKKGLLEKLGLVKPKEQEKSENPDLEECIRSEMPYVKYVSPFNFYVDPRATSIRNAQFVVEKITRKLSEIRKDSTYKNTNELEGAFIKGVDGADVPETQVDEFKVVDLYEVHYKTDEGINILTLAVEGDRSVALRHDESVYAMDGFQYEMLAFNKHEHRLYPVSDIDVVRKLQDRINTTFDSILEQVDKYVPKLFVNEGSVTAEGKIALRDGNIGSIVYCTGNPNDVVKEGSFTQLKSDLVILIDKVMDMLMLETGLTKAQLMGLSSAETATEAQIGQASSNLRVSDKLDAVNEFSKRQCRKLWQVIQQFVDLEEIKIIVGEQAIDEVTGVTKFSWLPDIDSGMADKMAKGEYRFSADVGSTEKPDLPILRKQLEGIANILMGQGVIQAFQAQGYKIELAEMFKLYLQQFPDVFKNISKIIKPIGPQTQGLMGQNPGAQPVDMQMLQSKPANTADIISSIGGEKGNIPIA